MLVHSLFPIFPYIISHNSVFPSFNHKSSHPFSPRRLSFSKTCRLAYGNRKQLLFLFFVAEGNPHLAFFELSVCFDHENNYFFLLKNSLSWRAFILQGSQGYFLVIFELLQNWNYSLLTLRQRQFYWYYLRKKVEPLISFPDIFIYFFGLTPPIFQIGPYWSLIFH